MSLKQFIIEYFIIAGIIIVSSFFFGQGIIASLIVFFTSVYLMSMIWREMFKKPNNSEEVKK